MADHSGQDRLDFIGIDDGVRAALREIKAPLAPSVERGLSLFYATISRAPEVAHLFRDDRHRDHAMTKQVDHWNNILSGQYNDAYFDTIRRVGRVHSDIGLAPRYYIAGYATVASELLRSAVREGCKGAPIGFGKPDTCKAEIYIDALVRAIFLDIEMGVSVYLEEAEAKARESRLEVADAFEQGVSGVIGRLTETSRALDEAADLVSRVVESTLGEASTAAAGAEEAATNVKSVSVAAGEMETASREIADQVARTSAITIEAVEQVTAASDTMQELNTAAAEIGSAVSLIQEIAEQTNLLALNATIESARAGESGKGFAVVASEVKALAGQTAKATDQIARQIADVQAATTRANSVIDAIRETINSVNSAAVTITAAVEEQSVVTREIVRNTTEAAAGNQNSSRATNALEASVREAGEAARQVTHSSASVRDEMGQLNERVAQFMTEARAG
ncbi:protoglobin domain-containing protein [Maricaulis sp.]|uniref:protoglobin domain-containing protein n=1 Tax=Maricaulis sp. TaxID=1486257 RepID=UPI003A8D7490